MREKNAMEMRRYHITMHTPLGTRCGTMSVMQKGRLLKGMLDILNHMEPFCGTIEKNGDCLFSGRLVTLMRSVEYSAKGNISPESVNLILQGERNCFHLYGSLIPEDGEPEQERK